MSSFFNKLRLNGSLRLSNTSSTTDSGAMESKEVGVTSITPAAEEPVADALVGPGELTFEEDTAGGMGRHLGLFSTTALMYV